MKCKRICKFEPITILLETYEEAEFLKDLIDAYFENIGSTEFLTRTDLGDAMKNLRDKLDHFLN